MTPKPSSFRPSDEAAEVLRVLMEKWDRSQSYVIEKAIILLGEKEGIIKPPKKKSPGK